MYVKEVIGDFELVNALIKSTADALKFRFRHTEKVMSGQVQILRNLFCLKVSYGL